jgi:16S rRNA (adenine1518-N6/adenine1519-N6)-dimethyltransferase
MIVARKRFGQHFLEPAWVPKLMQAIAPRSDDTFIEIGPGRGALTRPLSATAHRVVGFEIDRDLVRLLRSARMPHVTIVEGDFLDITSEKLADATEQREPRAAEQRGLRVIGNLPYNVASPILFKLIELYRAGAPLEDATLMLQREVADRLLARPGTRDYGVLTVLVRHTAAVDRLLSLPPGAFRPVPKVESAVVHLRFHSDDPPVKSRKTFEAVVRAVFTRRRKTLANALLAFPALDPSTTLGASPSTTLGASPSTTLGASPSTTLGASRRAIDEVLKASRIDGSRRPETLDIPEFAALADTLASSP